MKWVLLFILLAPFLLVWSIPRWPLWIFRWTLGPYVRLFWKRSIGIPVAILLLIIGTLAVVYLAADEAQRYDRLQATAIKGSMQPCETTASKLTDKIGSAFGEWVDTP